MIIRTLVTFTVSDDDERENLIGILRKSGYQDATDQSTMYHTSRIPSRTINTINEYCKNNVHGFDDLDTLTIFTSQIQDGKCCMEMLDYVYDSDKDMFI